MTLDDLFNSAGIEKPPINELVSIKTTNQFGPKIEKIAIRLAIDHSKIFDEALNEYLSKKKLENTKFNCWAIIRFGYETKVKLQYFYEFGYGEIELSQADQDYVHELMDAYLTKEYHMTADEMWRKEW